MKIINDFKKFLNENLETSDINVIIDVSSTMRPSDIDRLPQLIDCDECQKINIILVNTEVVKVDVISDFLELGDVFKTAPLNGGGTDLQPGIKYILDNGLENNKTYIVSDFYCEPLDYSGVSEYEEIKI